MTTKKTKSWIEVFTTGVSTAFDLTGTATGFNRDTSIGNAIRGDFNRVSKDLRRGVTKMRRESQHELFDGRSKG